MANLKGKKHDDVVSFFTALSRWMMRAFWQLMAAIGMRKGCALYIGRFAPAHKGHINVMLWLLEKHETLVIGIGSCYEVGSFRHPLLAIHRERMVLASLRDAGADLSRVVIVHIPDYVDDFDAWWSDVMGVVVKYGVTHFVTGNEEQILEPLRERNIPLPFALINPEKELPRRYFFLYHATQLREAIIRGDYELFRIIAATGTVSLMGSVGGFTALKLALENRGMQFVPGRQAVDLIMTAEGENGELMLLCGRRAMWKENFPGRLGLTGGGIDSLESPIDAAPREALEEAGISICIVDRCVEPLHVVVAERFIAEMRFVGLFGTDDAQWGGTQGGSSQVFHVHVCAPASQLEPYIQSNSDLTDVGFRVLTTALEEGLAYQQNEMVEKAAVSANIECAFAA